MQRVEHHPLMWLIVPQLPSPQGSEWSCIERLMQNQPRLAVAFAVGTWPWVCRSKEHRQRFVKTLEASSEWAMQYLLSSPWCHTNALAWATEAAEQGTQSELFRHRWWTQSGCLLLWQLYKGPTAEKQPDTELETPEKTNHKDCHRLLILTLLILGSFF